MSGSRHLSPFASIGFCFALAGCGEPTPPAESVPVGGLAKGALSGEWVMGTTTVWASPETDWAFEGETPVFTESSKVRWEVQEHHLVAYESFERVAGGGDASSTSLPVSSMTYTTFSVSASRPYRRM